MDAQPHKESFFVFRLVGFDKWCEAGVSFMLTMSDTNIEEVSSKILNANSFSSQTSKWVPTTKTLAGLSIIVVNNT